MTSPFAPGAPASSNGSKLDTSNPDLTHHLLSVVGNRAGQVNLNLGCGKAGMIPGWTNYDLNPAPGALFMNLEYPDFSPGLNGLVDCVLASHVLEHITNLIPLMAAIHRMLRPGGFLIAITPHASSDDAWEDPTHVRAFTEKSWAYFDRRMYERQEGHGSYNSPVDFCFDVVRVNIVPRSERWAMIEAMNLSSDQQNYMFRAMVDRERNAVQEIIATLRKVE